MAHPSSVTQVQSTPIQQAYSRAARGAAFSALDGGSPADIDRVVVSTGEPARQSRQADPETSRPTAGTQQNVSLRFIMDPESNELTVYMLDRSSKEVIRTIPPDEIRNLNAGDLLSLFA